MVIIGVLIRCINRIIERACGIELAGDMERVGGGVVSRCD